MVKRLTVRLTVRNGQERKLLKIQLEIFEISEKDAPRERQ